MAQILTLPRRGRPIIMDGRQAFCLFPTYPRNARVRWLYALGFSSGVTKIGMTRTPRKRLYQHWVANEGGVVWAHLFGRFPERVCYRIEAAALINAELVAERIRRTETFHGLTRDAAIAAVRRAIRETV